jgi:hypothetical protein
VYNWENIHQFFPSEKVEQLRKQIIDEFNMDMQWLGRGFRTLKQEFLNLVWIGNWDKFKDVLIDSRFEYNNRPHSSFGYRSPFETMNDAIMNLPQHVCGH